MKISIMMLYYRLHWTLWILSCFGQYLCQDLQIPAANGALGGSVELTPFNPPSTPFQFIQWSFTTTTIITAPSDGDPIINAAYKDRVSVDMKTLALNLMNLRQSDSGIYELRVTLDDDGGTLTGTTSLQVFVNVSDVRLTGPNKPLKVGDSATITSVGTGNISSVQWMKDNSTLSPSNSISFSPDNRSVYISPVNISDSGEYQCTYSNPFSSGTATLHLTVNSGEEGGGEGGGGLTTGAIVGIVIGVLVAVSGICGLIVYLIKTKKISKPTVRQNGQGSGAAQSREEPDMNYADVSHFQKASGERVILEDRSEPSTEYAEVKHGAKSKAPPRH